MTARTAPLRWQDMSAEQQALLGLLHQSAGVRAVADTLAGREPNIARTFVRHPGLFRRWAPMVAQITGGALPFRDRELIMLRTAVHAHGRYVWATHATLGPHAGLTREEIRRTGVDGTDGWEAADADLLAAVDAIHNSTEHDIDDPLWDRLAARYDEHALIEIPTLSGFARMVCYATTVIRVQPDPWMATDPPPPWIARAP